MSDHQLPHDLARWPDDPFELLGVPPEVDRGVLRRAYTRLIRQFKPETAPEAFRRIRDAYEAIQQHLSWRERWAADGAAPDDTDTEATSGHEAVRAPRFAQLVEAYWNEARHGDRQNAYRRLVELRQQRPGDEDLCSRLYWLLVLWPELDPVRKACDWLHDGIAHTGLAGRLAELYRSHLEHDPSEALSQRCANLLARPAQAWQLSSLAAARWQAAAAQHQYRVIPADLDVLREIYSAQENHDGWARLLLSAIDYLAWSSDETTTPALLSCRDELDGLMELHLGLSHELDRSDLLMELSDQVEQMAAEMPGSERLHSLELLIRNSWNRPFHSFRDTLLRLLRPWVADPVAGLRALDRLRKNAPAVLIRLGELIDVLYAQTVNTWEQRRLEGVASVVSDFFRRFSRKPYEELRFEIVRFCMTQWLRPADLTEKLRDLPGGAELTAALDTDAPVHYLLKAHEAFWT
jgi:hypothetical protein